ncbi:hypothetical protein BCR34DRAFT_587250 [Clohesyomyces aquaticus]|uniref:SET domain-containing protein n=1 Tax=Clohesyomyces aquaticus TaxID=1231657 RepID=A0A1Y1ZQD7_9PLEO|nr:hypothetical protein BCR34DRAFT_587250 [Clohesyomyces aquaticus]
MSLPRRALFTSQRISTPIPPSVPTRHKMESLNWVNIRTNQVFGAACYSYQDEQEASFCACSSLTGCGESCLNRSMLYECDDSNCKIGIPICTNRRFAELERVGGGLNRVQVMETSDRGRGVRATIILEPKQWIMEYVGEVITEADYERRVKCSPEVSWLACSLMPQLTGTIEVWIVGNKPRVAVVARSRNILLGEELAFDYNYYCFS